MNRPKVVALCGSTRFKKEFMDKFRELTSEGCTVMMPDALIYSYGKISEEQKKRLASCICGR